MQALGICVGASTIGLVRLSGGNGGPEVLWARTREHEGDSRGVLSAMLAEVEDLESLRVAATGRKFRHLLSLSTISEPEAVELAVGHALPGTDPCRTVISAGGETFMVYRLDRRGRVVGVHTGNKCASGTGEFLLQQLGRMGLTLDDVGGMEVGAPAHKVSGRCSVFCKSDCTHALNKGVPKMNVVAGLARMMAGKALELLKKLPKDRAVLVGGCSKNRFMVHYLRQDIGEVVIPEAAPWFEALGAGLWALEHEPEPFPGLGRIFVDRDTSFTFHKPLADFADMVAFKTHPRGRAREGDEVVVGLDVGSTTTKGVVMRVSDLAVLASDYLRTDGDPVGASRRVYASLASQVRTSVSITGLGVTGSGRAIAGLHAQTEGVVNEIIAHATAAVHFDKDVDTIFEIGGQDAKYTYITNGVPSDYAMNEACSAGTGSFLEESAKETLGVDVADIGDIAARGPRPPNFNDQCAAFISSDIMIATQEGLPLDDILAGLVYSICMNYANRVKGARPVGRKVFMQGGVCYNKAVPAAMAALTGKRIIVPPEPGLMGAFGVALEVKKRVDRGLLAPAGFDLDDLASREVAHEKPFICSGGKERCDRGCEIARIRIGDKVFPFGGICNRYDNIVHKRRVDAGSLNMVLKREKRLFRDLSPDDPEDKRPTIGLNRSYLINTYFPFFNTFFRDLGFRAVLPDTVREQGVDQQGSAFCFPGELAHGFLADLLDKKPDYLCLPHIRCIPGEPAKALSYTCVLVQGEPYYLRSAFPETGEWGDRLLVPVLNFSKGLAGAWRELMEVADRLGAGRAEANRAFEAAKAEQRAFNRDLKAMGAEALARLRSDPEQMGVVVFGRPYNAFASVANKAIPAKYATRGVMVLPYDMLPYEHESVEPDHNMYWGLGQTILKAGQLVKREPRLFGTFITNFSCGPDSFLVGYFRDLMGRKPSLTLELDSHTADAGLETRIEAFLDIATAYRQLLARRATSEAPRAGNTARMELRRGVYGVRTSEGDWLPLDHPRVRMLIPSMNAMGSRLVAASLGQDGIRGYALPPADEEQLKLGRGHSSCKECLPLQLTVGSLLDYLKKRDPDEVTVFVMPSAGGPCRFGQYNVFTSRAVAKLGVENAAIYAPTCLEGYGGLSQKVMSAIWKAIVIGDLFEEMRCTILAGAENPEEGLALLDRELAAIEGLMAGDWKPLAAQLDATASALSGIRLRKPYEEIPKISLIGEIYVRHDPVSRQRLVERLAERGFIVRTSQVTEWLKYTDWLIKTGIEGVRDQSFWIKYLVKGRFDRLIRKKLAPSGLFLPTSPKVVSEVLDIGRNYVSPLLTGEAILTVGAAFHEIMHPACGIISIGPFGCMPSRLAEAVLSEKFTTGELASLNGRSNGHPLFKENRRLPFLAIETDGNPFPQVIEARLEAFCLQAQRLHHRMLRP